MNGARSSPASHGARSGQCSASASPTSERRGNPRISNSIARSEEHTSELQSPCNLVCRLLLEKKKLAHHVRRSGGGADLVRPNEGAHAHAERHEPRPRRPLTKRHPSCARSTHLRQTRPCALPP